MIHYIDSLTNSDVLETMVAQKPRTVNGNYLIPIDRKPFYIQLPQSKLKSINKHGKKITTELSFPSFEKSSVVNLFKKIDQHSENIILGHLEWFETDLDENDIHSFFVPSCKEKSTSCVISAQVPTSISIFNESATEKLNLEDLVEDSEILSIIEIMGIKCLSKKFQIEIELKQIMIIPPQINLFEKCVIQPLHNTTTTSNMTKKQHIDLNKSVPPFDEVVEEVPPTVVSGSEQRRETTVMREENKEPTVVIEDKRAEVASVVSGSEQRRETTVVREENKEPTVVEDKGASASVAREDNKEPTVVREEKQLSESVGDGAQEIVSLEITANDETPVVIKSRSDIHYQEYLEAKAKAELAQQLAKLALFEAEEKKRMMGFENI